MYLHPSSQRRGNKRVYDDSVGAHPVVITMVQNDSVTSELGASKYAQISLRDDDYRAGKEMTDAAIIHHGEERSKRLKNKQHCLKSASISYVNVKSFFLKVVQQDGEALDFAPSSLQDDRDVVLTAVQQNGNALKFASLRLQGDSEIVLAALNQDGHALNFASLALRDDKETVLAAVRQNGRAIIYASLPLQDDKDVALAAVLQNGDLLSSLSLSQQEDKELVLAAVHTSIHVLKYISTCFLDDKDIVLAAVQLDGTSLAYASRTLRNNREVVLAAVQQNFRSFRFVSERLRSNLEVIIVAAANLNQNIKSYNCPSFVPKSHHILHKDYIIQSLKDHARKLESNVLSVACSVGLLWYVGIKELVCENPDGLSIADERTGLFPFMLLAASSCKSYVPSDLDTIFQVLISCPDVVSGLRFHHSPAERH